MFFPQSSVEFFLHFKSLTDETAKCSCAISVQFVSKTGMLRTKYHRKLSLKINLSSKVGLYG